jgi:hypothetical protein
MWLISIGNSMGEFLQSLAEEGPIGLTNILVMGQMVKDTFLSGHMILGIDQGTESLSTWKELMRVEAPLTVESQAV